MSLKWKACTGAKAHLDRRSICSKENIPLLWEPSWLAISAVFKNV